MKNDLSRTHTKFEVESDYWQTTIKTVRAKLGESSHLQAYHVRPWITDGYYLHVRNDLLDDSFITYLGLIAKFKQ